MHFFYLWFQEYAFEFIKKGGGKTTEANYPYRAHDGACDVKKGFSRSTKRDLWNYSIA